jgi:hypothetical protein
VPPGIVINHTPARLQQYFGSPSIAVLPDGDYVASHDYFGPGTDYNQVLVFRSSDRGHTWKKTAEVEGFWSNLFMHGDALYLMGVSCQYGHVIVRRSDDGGSTWTEPTDRKSGLLYDDGKYHTAPMPVVEHDGRLWRTMEDAMGEGGWPSHFRARMLSVPADADLLNADNWIRTNPIAKNPDWLDGRFNGWLEGNAVVTPGGEAVNILRVDDHVGGKAAVIRISKDGKAATFDPSDGFIDFPGGAKKFSIRYDPQTRKYWTLTNWVPKRYEDANPARSRNIVALANSSDLRTWEVHCVLVHHEDVLYHGYQYVDWLFDGADMIAVIRTADDDVDGGAHNQHDANFLTFHRFENFRDLTSVDSVVSVEFLSVSDDD